MIHHTVPQTCFSGLEEKDILGRTEMSPVHFLYRCTVGNNAFHDRYAIADLSNGGEAVFIRLEGDGEAIVVRHADIWGAGLRAAPFRNEDFEWSGPVDSMGTSMLGKSVADIAEKYGIARKFQTPNVFNKLTV